MIDQAITVKIYKKKFFGNNNLKNMLTNLPSIDIEEYPPNNTV